jgi:hypothetical protein
MRDLISLIESLSVVTTESSRGLLFRKEGDRFFKGSRDAPTEALLFDKAEYFPGRPPEGPGAYDSYEEMVDAYQDLEKQIGNITPVNSLMKSFRAFTVLTLHDEVTEQPVYYAKFYQQIRPDMTGAWPNKEIPGFQLATKTSLKGSYNLKPADLFPGNARFPNINAVWTALQQSEDAQPYLPGLSMLFGSSPELPKFEGAGDKATAIRDDLGETIGPVALIQGLDVGGGAEAARRGLNDGKPWAGSSVNFPSEKNYGLVDSYFVTPSGVEIGISSKGEDGAKASIKNIADGIKFIRTKGTDEQKKLLDQYSEQIEIIDDIGSASVIGYPLKYGVANGLISTDAARYIQELIKSGAKNLENFPPSNGSQSAISEVKQLIDSRNAKTGLDNYNAGYDALAALASQVASAIGADPKFGEACLKFVNSSPIIQLHMYTKTNKDDSVDVTKFVSKYPPNFQGTIILNPKKTYSGTGATGRMSFDYKGKDAGFKDDDTVGGDVAVPSEKEFTKGAEKIAQGRDISEPNDRPTQVGDVGRKKRTVR